MAASKCLKVLRTDRVYLIGRNTTSDVVINHPSISVNHCRIQVSKAGLEVEEIADKDSASARPLPITLVSGDDDSEPKSKPRLPCKIKLRLAITDNSSNGTWLYPKTQYRGACTKSSHVDASQNDSLTDSELFAPVDSDTLKQTLRPRRLERDKESELHVGDLIFLLSPAHPDAGHYCYRLRWGTGPGELALCQVDPEVVTQITQHVRSSLKRQSTMNEPQRKEDDDPPDLKRTRLDNNAHSKPTDVATPAVIALHKELSMELCPHCRQLFSIIELVAHVEGCGSKGEASNGSPIDLEQCVYCLEEYPVAELVEHALLCPKRVDEPTPSQEEVEHCQHCLKLFPISELIAHSRICTERRASTETPPSSSSNSKLAATHGAVADPLERCMHCFRDFPLSELVGHASLCDGEMLGSKERYKDFLPSAHDVDPLAVSVLTMLQEEAVDYVRKKSKEDSSKLYPTLREKVVNLGYGPKDLEKTLHWVRYEAPIIIHLNLDKTLEFLVKDTHYRNLFEVGMGGGGLSTSSRVDWEDNIFNRIYHSSSPMERVKYGVLNIVGDPCGVRCCYSYGDSFLQLKKVRLRTTFASMDTSVHSVKLSCCEHYGNVLVEYSSKELKAIMDVATHKKAYLESSRIETYKEVQIHGPVCLSENVDCIVANSRHRTDKKMVKLLQRFIEQNHCNLIWMDPPTTPDDIIYTYESNSGSDY